MVYIDWITLSPVIISILLSIAILWRYSQLTKIVSQLLTALEMLHAMVEQANRMEELYEDILKTNRNLVREVKKSVKGSTKGVDEALKKEKLELEKLKEDRRQRDLQLKEWKTMINTFKTILK